MEFYQWYKQQRIYTLQPKIADAESYDGGIASAKAESVIFFSFLRSKFKTELQRRNYIGGISHKRHN